MNTIIKSLKNSELIKSHYLLFSIILSVILNLSIEIMARMSFTDALLYLFTHPLIFTYNVSLILLTFSVALLCKKRVFSMLLIVVLWLTTGIINAVLLYHRRTPFIAADFFIIKSAFAIMDVYLTKPEMFFILFSTIFIIGFLVFIAIKEKSKHADYKKIAMFIAITFVVSILPSNFIVNAKNKSETPNITQDAYDYGFVFCFINSIFNSGISRPDLYSKNYIDKIMNMITPEDESFSSLHPNVIFVQLESFVDPYIIPGVSYSMDPIPNFRKYKESFTSGKLNVSVYGGGTANTEFEVLTGMNIDYFGIGEYPYKTVLQEQPVESVAYNLKEYGYSTHALHNHTGTFYDRHKVYKNLGFDTFTPKEYMNNIEFNRLGWEKSPVFTDYILKAMQSTENRDFVFTVTSQCHGKYPQYKIDDAKIKVTGSASINNIKNDLEYYVNELYEEDKWIGEFLEQIASFPEPVMVVMYGDHMPSLNFPEKMLSQRTIYQTEYFIYQNYMAKKENKNLDTFNLSAFALDRIGFHHGTTTRLHQYEINTDKKYDYALKSIQYDMLYGDKYIYGEDKISPYSTTEMTLGLDEIKITKVNKKGKEALIIGENFTPDSVVYVDDDLVETTFIDSATLKIKSSDLKNYKKISVAQRTAEEFTNLGFCEPYYK